MNYKAMESNNSVFAPKIENPDLSRLNALLEDAHPKLVGVDGEVISLPESIYQILRQVTPILLQGKGVTLIPQDHYFTTQEAANLLNISRPYLYTLLDKGEIPYTMMGTHKRIKNEDLLEYKARRDNERRQALSELIETSQELGFYQAETEDNQETI